MEIENVKSLAVSVYDGVHRELRAHYKGKLTLGEMTRVIQEVKKAPGNEKLNNTEAIEKLAASLIEWNKQPAKAKPHLHTLAKWIKSFESAAALPFMTRAYIQIALKQFEKTEPLNFFGRLKFYVTEALSSIARLFRGVYVPSKKIWEAQKVVKNAENPQQVTAAVAQVAEKLKKTGVDAASAVGNGLVNLAAAQTDEKAKAAGKLLDQTLAQAVAITVEGIEQAYKNGSISLFIPKNELTKALSVSELRDKVKAFQEYATNALGEILLKQGGIDPHWLNALHRLDGNPQEKVAFLLAFVNAMKDSPHCAEFKVPAQHLLAQMGRVFLTNETAFTKGFASLIHFLREYANTKGWEGIFPENPDTNYLYLCAILLAKR